MKHLSEDILIQYAFDLLETDAKVETAAHLDACEECKRQLEQIRAKFAALDVLETDEVLSDDLIAKTLLNPKQKPEADLSSIAAEAKEEAPGCDPLCDTAPSTPHAAHTGAPSGDLRRSAFKWIASAAAVLVVGAWVWINQPEEIAPPDSLSPTREIAKAPANEIDPVLGVADKPETPIKAQRRKSPDEISENVIAGAQTSQSDPLRPAAVAKTVVSAAQPLNLAENKVRVVDAETIPDKAPFAPASAIELVVLPKPDKTQLTIYNSADLTLVRDTRKLTLKPGWNWLQFMWNDTQIDPTSLSLRPLKHAEHIDIDLISYPARLKDIGRWLIRSEVEGAVPFEITYFASGLSWRAFYMGTMNEDETHMNLKGYVNVANHSGQDFTNAQTRLIVGQTRLIEEISFLAQQPNPYGPYIYDDGSVTKYNWHGLDKDGDDAFKTDGPELNWFFDTSGGIGGNMNGSINRSDRFEVKEIEKTGLSEYFLYTIEGTEDLPNTWAKRLPSFDADDIPVKSLYKYDEDRYGNQAVRFVSFANDAEHELGATPIPEGRIKIYRNLNKVQNLAYVGQSDFKYIPVNEDVELNLGAARLVKVEPTLMNRKTDNYIYNHKGDIDGFDDIETWQIKVTNTRDIGADIEITRDFGTDAWEMAFDDDTAKYKKHDKTRARFTLTVPPRTETMFTYTVTKYQGRRTEAYVKMQNH